MRYELPPCEMSPDATVEELQSAMKDFEVGPEFEIRIQILRDKVKNRKGVMPRDSKSALPHVIPNLRASEVRRAS